MESEELKPCPFCGGEMVLSHDHTTENIDTIQHAEHGRFCPINYVDAFSLGNENLIKAWNTRV